VLKFEIQKKHNQKQIIADEILKMLFVNYLLSINGQPLC